jgi:DNA repair exonuclease SbcCD ATPase subunit
MITFQTIRWKNFLSTGNAFTEVVLNKKQTTLIVGENGSGKSTLLDAICFGLFGKPYRKINKPQLINAINKKDMVVEIEFNIGTKQYKIIRGTNPNIFEIYQQGELIDQDAASKDYQKYLEQTILKLNYKSFIQIVILGSASFTPFMQLPAVTRREIIEDILDIQIFTTMNTVLKENLTTLKESITQSESRLQLIRQKSEIQMNYLVTLKNNKEKRTEELEQQIQQTIEKIEANKKVLDELLIPQKDQLQNELSVFGNLSQNIMSVEEYRRNYHADTVKLEKEIRFYQNTELCPTCQQHLDKNFIAEMLNEKLQDKTKLESSLQKINDKLVELSRKRQDQQAIESKLSEVEQRIRERMNVILVDSRFAGTLKTELENILMDSSDIEKEKSKLELLVNDGVEEEKEKDRLTQDKYYMDAASRLLKDNGIKTIIIRQYLDAINKYINKYLTAMDFFVQFTLDEEFNESIKSRYRDEFSYASFSEGEKQRIDLALLFTWRAIAKIKNSTNTNLLILDEVFDSSLDTTGTEFVMHLLNTIDTDTHVFVISHKGDQLFDKFDTQIKFEKKNNYSVMV